MASSRETSFDPTQKIWSGRMLESLYDRDASIGQVALSVLQKNPKKIIQICNTTGEQLTAQSLVQFGIRVAQYFKHKLGLHQGDVIGIMGSNTTYLAPVVLGAFLIASPINSVHYTFDKKTVEHMFGITRPTVVFCDGAAYDTLRQALDDIGLNCKIFTLSGHVNEVPNVKELLKEDESEEEFIPAVLQNGGDHTAAILCSSGTTGLPKGVCISHRNLLSRLPHDISSVGPNDVLFTFSTLYWISGLWFLVESFITGALRVITDQPFSPELFLDLVEKYKITHIIGPPSHAALTLQCPSIASRDLSSVRTYVCGGSAVSASLSNKMAKYLGNNSLCEAYGLTEFGGVTSLNEWPHQKVGSVGRLSPNTRVKILQDDGQPLGINETGEIYVWSPFKWNGYYGNPGMNRLIVDGKGWIRTGDLGYFDEDGFLFVIGRQKEILKYRSFQISPAEIEEPIQKIPGVVEVCVFGVPDAVACDLPAAAIIKSPDCTLTEEDVCETVASCLSEDKHLHGGVYFVPELPKTPSGKIQRQKVLPFIAEMRKI